MIARLGNVIFWFFCGLAVCFFGFGILGQVYREVSVPFPYFNYVFRQEYIKYTAPELFAYAISVLLYLFGRAVRYILAGT